MFACCVFGFSVFDDAFFELVGLYSTTIHAEYIPHNITFLAHPFLFFYLELQFKIL